MSKNTRLIADNDMAFQIVPSDLTQWEALADFFVYNGSTNFILVHRGNQAEIDALEVFKKKLTASVDAIGGRIKVSIVNYKLGGLSAIRDKLNGNSNTIVVPSEVEVFVTDLVAKLNTLAMSYPIELAGPQTWENFENVTFDYLHNLQFCTTTPSWVDYNNPNVKAFVEDYRLKFNSEPSQYAFYGYDTFLYFGQMLKSNGPNFSYCVENTKTDGLQSIWNFEKSTQLGGLENRGVWVLRYEKGTSLSAFKVFQDDERHVERVMTEAADNE
jgi:hypothetical protein